MEKNNLFSASRFILLIKRFIILNIKTWAIGLAAATGLIILIAIAQAYLFGISFNYNGLVNFGLVQIFIGGFIVASMAYKELNSPARSQFYLTLPATTLEKLLSHWFVTSILFIVVANILLAFAISLSSVFCNLIWGSAIEYFNPFAIANLKIMATFLVLQSIFFLGATYFRKNNFIKTVLVIFIISQILMVFMIIITFLLFKSGNPYMSENIINTEFQLVFESTFKNLVQIAYFGLLAPFCLLVSYFRLKEREV